MDTVAHAQNIAAGGGGFKTWPVGLAMEES